MSGKSKLHDLVKCCALAVLVAQLAACGGGGSDSAIVSTAPGGSSGGTGSVTPTGTASLTWEAPLTNGDGTPLASGEIAGFRVYTGTDSNSLALVADINDGSVTTHTVTGLPQGTNYFAVTAYNYSSYESRKSNIASKTVP